MSSASKMIRFIITLFLVTPVLELYAVPVTQTSSADTLVYDAVVVGTNNIVELRPATTGLPTPVSTFTNVDISTCGSGEICIEQVFTDSASHVVSSVVAEFSVLPASIVSALENIVGAIEAGIEAGRTGSISMDGAVSVSPSSGSSRQAGPVGSVTSNSTRQGGTTGVLSASKELSGQTAFSTGPLPLESATSDMVSKSLISTTTSITSAGGGAMAPARNTSGGRITPVSTYNAAFTTAKSLSGTSQGLGGSNRTISTTLTTPPPTGPVTYALEVTNSQGSVTDEVVEVGYHSGVLSTNVLLAYADSVTTTETSMPSGVSIQTTTTSTCTTAGEVITTTSSGSTITTEVPELCTNGLVFLFFGLPGFHSSSDLPSLCHKTFTFPLGIIWRLLCPTIGPPNFLIISVDPKVLPPGGGPPGENPNDGNPDEENPTHTQGPSQTQRPSSTTQSTVSSSAAATPSRYVVMPLISTPQSATDSLFAPYAQRKNVTQAKRSDGSLEFFALDLSDTEATTIDAHSDFIIMQESDLDIEMIDSGQTDPGLNGANYATEPLESNPNVGSRDFRDKDKRSKGGGLSKRISLQGWAEKITSWTLAIISLVPGLPLPNYDYDEIYPYYYIDAIAPGQNVRVYLLDTGLNMQPPEFNGRLKPGIARGRTQDDWDIDWLFPRVDRNEWFYAQNPSGQLVRQWYEYSYVDPDSPNPRGGIHPAYSDFRLREVDYGNLTPHGTRVSAFIMGDELGQAQDCRFTVVKLPQYINGPRSTGTLFPLFSVKDALTLIVEDIMDKKEQGEELFVISSALGYLFSHDPDDHPISARRGFSRMWQNVLDWFDSNGVTISASAGNSRSVNPDISLIPARLFRDPEIVIGSVTPRALAHPQSQGHIGDGHLTAYAPGPGNRMISNDPSGNYIYQYIDPAGSAVTSYGT